MFMVRRSIFKLVFLLSFFCGFWGYSQDNGNISTDTVPTETPPPTVLSEQATRDIVGFGDFKLGMSYEDVQKLIGKAPYTFLIVNNKPQINPPRDTISMYKNDFFDLFRLQFSMDNKMYLLQIQINKEHQNFTELYKLMKERYGMPQSVTYDEMAWEKNKKKIILLRSGMIRYLDTEILEAQIEKIKQAKTLPKETPAVSTPEPSKNEVTDTQKAEIEAKGGEVPPPVNPETKQIQTEEAKENIKVYEDILKLY